MNSHLGVFKFWCAQCKKGYQNRANYNQHMNKHEGRTFPCEICNKIFSVKSSLRRHQTEFDGCRRNKTENDTSHSNICPICGKTILSKFGYDAHVARHSGKFKFWCSTCEKGYWNRANYDQHMNKHLGITFSCELCTKKFLVKSSLKRHLEKCHMETPQCDSASVEKSNADPSIVEILKRSDSFSIEKSHSNLEPMGIFDKCDSEPTSMSTLNKCYSEPGSGEKSHSDPVSEDS